MAISNITRRRIRNYFGRDASVVYPPVDTERFKPASGPGQHYLVLSELVSHKRIDDAVRAFTDLALPLVVVGDGPDARRLKRMAGPTIAFAGRVSDTEAARLVTESRALVLTAVEEFGIAGVETQAAGRPVIAQEGGGALETVIDGVTGCFYNGGPEELAKAVADFDTEADRPGLHRQRRAVRPRGVPGGVPAEVDHAHGAGARRAAQRGAGRRRAPPAPPCAACPAACSAYSSAGSPRRLQTARSCSRSRA